MPHLTRGQGSGSGGAPSGSAGGVLSGTYPNPGFAVDQASQAELDASASGEVTARNAAIASAISTAMADKVGGVVWNGIGTTPNPPSDTLFNFWISPTAPGDGKPSVDDLWFDSDA